MRHAATLATIVFVCAATACAPGGPSSHGQAITPTPEQAGNAAYEGLLDDGPVTLAEGRFENAEQRVSVGLAEGAQATGDLDGDGVDDLVVLLWVSTGGSGTFEYLAALTAAADPDAPVQAVPVGDRVKLRAMTVDSATVRLDVLQAGIDDAMCCPGELATRSFSWDAPGGTLVEGTPSNVGRLSLAALEGDWRLVAWNIGEPAPDEPAVTLTFSGGNVAGSSGCNRYGGSAAEGDASPGELSLGPLIATQMACPEPAMTVESRYLAALEGVRRYTFHLGRLALESQAPDGSATLLLFERVAP